MKKKLFIMGGIMIVAIMICSFFSVPRYADAILQFDKLEALAECENTVKTEGAIITVTVCNRKTNIGGAMLDVKCNVTAETSCSFTNVGTPKAPSTY